MNGGRMKSRYRVLVGLTYPDGDKNVGLARHGRLNDVTAWKRAEVGDVVNDIPVVSISWLLAAGKIESVEDGES